MNHQEIEQLNIADRYVMGKLTAAERTDFETHLIDCHECLDRIENIESFRSGLQRVTAEEAARAHVAVQLGLLARLRKIRLRQAMLIAALVLAAALPVGLLISRMKGSGPGTPIAAVSPEPSKAPVSDDQEKLRQELREAQEKWAVERRELENKIAQATARRDRGSERTVPGQLPVFPLDAERGVERGGSSNQISIPRTNGPVVLVLELEPDPDILSYSTKLQNSAGMTVWKQANLKPTTRESIIISVDSALLKPGQFVITLSGRLADGRVVPVKRYSFRAAAK